MNGTRKYAWSDDFEVGHHAHVLVLGVVAVEDVAAAVAVEAGDDLHSLAGAEVDSVLEATVLGVRGSPAAGENLEVDQVQMDRVVQVGDEAPDLDVAAGLTHGGVAVAAETLLTLATLVAGFRVQHPGVDIRLYQSIPESMVHQLRRGEVDLCLASQPLDDPSLTAVELLREEVLLAVPLSHPLAALDRTDVDALAGSGSSPPAAGTGNVR